MSEQRFAELEKKQGIMELQMINFEKTQERQDKKITILDERTDEMGKFVVRMDLLMDRMDETTKETRTSLLEFITKQEVKEEEKQKAETHRNEKEISKWKTVAFELGKWVLIILGAGKLLQDGTGVFTTLFRF